MAERVISYETLSDDNIYEMIGGKSPAELETDIRIQQPTELSPTIMQQYRSLGIEEKVTRGETLTPQEQFFFNQFGNPTIRGMQQLTQTTGKLVGQTGRQVGYGIKKAAPIVAGMVISSSATAAGAMLGLKIANMRKYGQIGQGIMRTAGLMAGAAAGSEINQAVGLETDSNWNTGIAVLTVGAAQAISRIGRRIGSGTTAARIIRGMKAGDIVEGAPINAVRASAERDLGHALPRLTNRNLNEHVNRLYNQVRGLGEGGTRGAPIDVTGMGRVAKRLNPPSAQLIDRQLGQMSPDLQQRFRFMLVGLDTRPRFANVPGGIYTSMHFTGEEALDMRLALNNLRNGLMTSTGRTQAADKKHAQEVIRLVRALDSQIDTAARAGNQAAIKLRTATRVANMNFAQRELRDYLHNATRDISSRRASGVEINLAKLQRDIRYARELNVSGDDGPLTGFVRWLDTQPGGSKAFDNDIEQLKRLAPNNNVQFFGNTFGFITRSAAIAADVTFLNAGSELLMSPAGRVVMRQLIETNGPTMFPPILAVALAAARVPLSSDEVDMQNQILQRVRSLGEYMNTGVRRSDTALGPRDVIDPTTGERLPPVLQAPPEQRRRQRPAPESLPPGQRGMASPSFMPF